MPAVNGPLVLVVEDQEPVRRLLGIALQHFGLRVRLAASGIEAVRLYQEHGSSINVVLLDVQMPDMDGPQTLSALQKLNPDACIVFMTGYMAKGTEEDLLAMGARRVIRKPFPSLPELSQTLRDMAS